MPTGYDRHGEGIEVDLAALRRTGDVLFDVATQVRRVDTDVQAATVQAARAFDGWRTGKSLTGLAQFWGREFDALADDTGKLGNAAMEAASNYTAADQRAEATMPVDQTYFRGR